MKTLAVIGLSLLIPGLLFSQLTVDDSFTAEYLVNEVLLGGGIEAENITINGVPADVANEQIAFFNASGSNIGISSGVIIASGGAKVAESPNDLPTANVSILEDEELSTEPDLEQIVYPAELNDVAVLEFDFTAEGDTLRFKYVFASEEYNEHTCSPYNDVFGFFISGPGINGNPNYENNAKNVALVPGTTVPVAINTVNQGFAGAYGSENVCNLTSQNWQNNSQYFVDNENNESFNATQFDGFTIPFLVEIPVVCGGTYHIKLAIADAIDDKNDSAVFIEAGSFESSAPLEADVFVADSPGPNNEAMEGCSKLQIDLYRPDSLGSKTVYVRTVGLTDQEIILPDLPDSIRFSHLDGFKSFNLDVYSNDEFEGSREIELQFLQTEVCSTDTTIISKFFTLSDYPSLEISYPDTIVLDCVDNAQITLEVLGGNPPYGIVWNDDEYSGFTVEVDPDEALQIEAVVTDACNIHTENISVYVYREEYDDLSITLPEDVGFNCADEVYIAPIVSGGFGEYTFTWSQEGNTLSTDSVLNQIIQEEGEVQLFVEDRCAPANSGIVNMVNMTSPVSVHLGTDTTGICTEIMTLIPEVQGGFGGLSYIWKKDGNEISTNSVFSFTPSATSLIELDVSDECDQSNSDDIIVYLYNTPLNINLPADTAICLGERLELHPNPSGGYGEYNITWSSTSNEQLSVIPRRSESYFVEVADECGSIAEHEIYVDVQEVIADFEFLYLDPYKSIKNHSTRNAQYLWNFPDGTSSEDFEPIISDNALKQGRTSLFVINQLGCFDEEFKDFQPPFSVYLPTAFTPDGDGLNDVFKAETEFVEYFEIRIFDRWGNLVFYSNDVNEGWNGDTSEGRLTSGENIIYNYVYKAVSWTGQIDQGKGIVTLLR